MTVQLAASTEVQKAQRRAAMGMSLRNSGHVFALGSGRRLTTPDAYQQLVHRHHNEEADRTANQENETTALMKSPIRNLLRLIVNWIDEKSGLPTMAAISGVITSLTIRASFGITKNCCRTRASDWK